MRLKVLLTVHIDEHLLGVHLLLGKLSAELSAQLSTQKSLLTIHSLAALSTVHGLGARAVQRRQLALLANIVEEFDGGLGGQTLLDVNVRYIDMFRYI